ncbi:MAG: hypothetical protein ABSC60_14925 [Acidobacteriota bacterium]
MSGQYCTRIWSKLLSPVIQGELDRECRGQGESAQEQTRGCRGWKEDLLEMRRL